MRQHSQRFVGPRLALHVESRPSAKLEAKLEDRPTALSLTFTPLPNVASAIQTRYREPKVDK